MSRCFQYLALALTSVMLIWPVPVAAREMQRGGGGASIQHMGDRGGSSFQRMGDRGGIVRQQQRGTTFQRNRWADSRSNIGSERLSQRSQRFDRLSDRRGGSSGRGDHFGRGDRFSNRDRFNRHKPGIYDTPFKRGEFKHYGYGYRDRDFDHRYKGYYKDYGRNRYRYNDYDRSNRYSCRYGNCGYGYGYGYGYGGYGYSYAPYTYYDRDYSYGELKIDSHPTSAYIYIDGAYYGQTPEVFTLPFGTYEVEVYKPGYDREIRRIGVSSDYRSVQFRLRRL